MTSFTLALVGSDMNGVRPLGAVMCHESPIECAAGLE